MSRATSLSSFSSLSQWSARWHFVQLTPRERVKACIVRSRREAGTSPSVLTFLKTSFDGRSSLPWIAFCTSATYLSTSA